MCSFLNSMSFRFFYYRPQRSCKGYVFTHVCRSVHRGGWCYPACIAGGIPACLAAGGLSAPGGACSGGGLLWGVPCSWGVPARGGVCSWEVACSGGVWRPPPPHESRRLLLRTVRILLECIVVISSLHSTDMLLGNWLFLTIWDMRRKYFRGEFVKLCLLFTFTGTLLYWHDGMKG